MHPEYYLTVLSLVCHFKPLHHFKIEQNECKCSKAMQKRKKENKNCILDYIIPVGLLATSLHHCRPAGIQQLGENIGETPNIMCDEPSRSIIFSQTHKSLYSL